MVLAFCRRGSVIPICLYLLVGRYMKKTISKLKNESSKTKRNEIEWRITTLLALLSIILYYKVSSTFLINLFLVWHINTRIEEIMADHVKHEITKKYIKLYFRLLLFIIIKDLFLLYFL